MPVHTFGRAAQPGMAQGCNGLRIRCTNAARDSFEHPSIRRTLCGHGLNENLVTIRDL